MSKLDIKITEVEKVEPHLKKVKLSAGSIDYKYNVPVSSKLKLNFEGTSINNVVINTIKRVLLDDIPSYAFIDDTITITKNTTIFNSDMMRNRLSQLPVVDTDNDLFYLDPIYWRNVDFSDPKRKKHESEKSIELSLNAYNDTQFIKNVTTNDIKYYEDGTQIDQKYNKDSPILLIQLKPADSFECSMKAVLGVGEGNNKWASVSTAFMDDNCNDNFTGEAIKLTTPKISFTLESAGQSDEYVLISKACKYIKKKLDDIKTEINKRVLSKEIKDGKIIQFILINEDHTIGELINNAFQSHPKIIFSGVSKPDHLVKAIKIKISASDSPIKHMFEQFEYLIGLYDNIEKQLDKLSKKTKK